MPKTVEINLTLTLEIEGEDMTVTGVSIEGAEDIHIELNGNEITQDDKILGVDKTTALAVGMGMLGIGQGK